MKYSDIYSPPAPLALATLRNPYTLESIPDVPILLDTGSDVTLLPKPFCDRLGVEPSTTEFLELEAFNQSRIIAFYIKLEFVFLKKSCFVAIFLCTTKPRVLLDAIY